MIAGEYFDRFATPKYHNRNPVQRWLISRFTRRIHQLFLEIQPFETIIEVGAGEGFLSGFLSQQFPNARFLAIDRNEEDLLRLKRLFPQVHTRQMNMADLGTLDETPQVILCAEVLEHLQNPHVVLGSIARMGPRHVIFSVPHEPFFRLSNLLRGKNLSRFGDDPEHVQHFSRGSFCRLLDEEFHIIRLTTSYPWLLALVAPKG